MTFLFSPTNHLLELARSGKRLPHILLAIFLTFIFVLVAQFAGGIPALIIVVLLSMLESGASFDNPESIGALALPNTALEQAFFLILAFLPIFLILWGWLALFEKRPFWTIGLERAGMVKKYLRGLLIGLLMFVASIGISAAMGFMAFEDGTQQGITVLGGVLLVFFGWMIQGAAEEAVTRGWLFPVIGARYNTMLGLIISSVVFSALHSLNFIGLDMNPGYIALTMLNLFLFGVFTVLFALYEGGLWGVFSIHSVWNWVQGNLFGFEVSGGAAPGGTLFNLMEVGPDVITGGPFGPEGGLAVTIVLLVSCALVVWVSQKKETVNEMLEIRS